MAVDEPVELGSGTGRGPGELGHGDNDAGGGHVGSGRPGLAGAGHESLGSSSMRSCASFELPAALVEGVGHNRAEGPDPLFGPGVHEARQRLEGSGVSASAIRPPPTYGS